jgi:hypothetical protein
MITRPLPEAPAEGSAATPKRARGAQKCNSNAKKHGLYGADARRVDLRRREDRAVFETLRAIEGDLGGTDEISSQQRVVLESIGRKLRDLLKLEAYLESGISIINKRRRCLIPAVLEKHRILESIRRDLETIGLERRQPKALDLRAYLEKRTEQAS